MSLPVGEARSLARIERSLTKSDPVLASLTAMFTRLTEHGEMPERERLRLGCSPLLRGGLLTGVLLTLLLAGILAAILTGGTHGPRVACPASALPCSIAPRQSLQWVSHF